MFKKVALLGATGLLMVSSAALSQGNAGITDAQIAHIAYTAGAIDVTAGKQALQKSKNRAVREFAQEMVRDHQAVNDQALALVRKLGVSPEDNATSQALTQQAATKQAELARLNGPAFDRAYVSNEIAYHRTVNAALKDTLIPGAHNGELKALLQTGLALFTEHQTHAEHLTSSSH
jgi:putative membrane protein